MSFISLPFALRGPARCSPTFHRAFHTSTTSRASVLFALSSLSNSRETQHFNKLSRLSRVEHSPPLKLIKTGEVDAFPLPDPPKPLPQPMIRPAVSPRSAVAIWDDKALKIGRAMLADQGRQTHRLYRALSRAKRREVRQKTSMMREKLSWQQERRKLRNDMRAAGMWILLSIGTATALATWRFWPEPNVVDSGDLGRKIAARASAAMPLPPAVWVEPNDCIPAVPESPPPPLSPKETDTPAPQSATILPPDPARSWWKGLFWKQQ